MEKLKLLVLIFFSLLILLAGAFLVYRYRESGLIRGFTDDPVNLREINRLAKITNPLFWPKYIQSDSLPVYQLMLQPDSLIKLKTSLPPIAQTVLVESFNTSAPAEFTDDQGKTYQVEVRYRGNGAVHWAFTKKSWRIKFIDEAFHGLTSIDLIVPEDRGLVMEHLANFRAQKLGLYYPDSWYAKLRVNGGGTMAYYVTEKVDEEFIKRRGLTGTLFSGRDDVSNWNENIYESAERWRTFPEDSNSPDFDKLARLLELINDPDATTAEIGEFLDLDKFLRWHVHSLLMASIHQDQSHNNRLFFNHQTQKFEFIPWDTGQREMVTERLDYQVHPVVKKLLTYPEIISARNKLLLQYLEDDQFLDQDRQYFKDSLESLWVALLKDSNKFYPNIKYYLDIKTYNQWMDEHFSNLLHQL